MSDKLLDFIEKHAVCDEFYPLEKGLFTFHQITINPIIAIEIWVSGEKGPFLRGVGSSKPNPKYDRFSFVRGRSIALRRAAKDLVFLLGGYYIQDMKDNLEAIEKEEKRLGELLNQAEEDAIVSDPLTEEDWDELAENIQEQFLIQDSGGMDQWVERGKFVSKRSKLDVPTAFVIK